MRIVDTVAYRVQSLQDERDDMQTVQVAADTDDVVNLADPESLQGVQLIPSSQANVTRIRVIPYLFRLFFTSTDTSAR